MEPFRYELRAATREDQGALLELAGFLDSVNLPNDPVEVGRIVEKSEQSFRGLIDDPRRREYVFVLRDLNDGKAVGTSLIVSQLGRRDAPYIFLQVRQEERYSATLDRHFVHDVLSVGYSYDGPTEIGGLVMHPGYRRAPEKLGMMISYVRFLWITAHRPEFQNHVLAELLPPLEPDGTSHLWEAVGRRFTGMSYREADRLSKRNKEFIRGLFPDGDIYASLLSEQAQAVLGEVGPKTRGVEKLLRRIGFRYVQRVDPFDGGPHFVAPTDDITLVQRSARRTLLAAEPDPHAKRALVAWTGDAAPYFRAIAVPASPDGDGLRVGSRCLRVLGVSEGARLWTLPLG
ncbi:MAG: arginine N-succinyltransferase [Myxococcota bacterium]